MLDDYERQGWDSRSGFSGFQDERSQAAWPEIFIKYRFASYLLFINHEWNIPTLSPTNETNIVVNLLSVLQQFSERLSAYHDHLVSQPRRRCTILEPGLRYNISHLFTSVKSEKFYPRRDSQKVFDRGRIWRRYLRLHGEVLSLGVSLLILAPRHPSTGNNPYIFTDIRYTFLYANLS
jgi:hypothetical protein